MDAATSQAQIVTVELARRGIALALFIAAATLAFGYGQTLFRARIRHRRHSRLLAAAAAE